MSLQRQLDHWHDQLWFFDGQEEQLLLGLESQLARLPLAAGEGDFAAIMQEAGIFHFAAQIRQVQMFEWPGKDVHVEFVAFGGQEQYHGTLIDQAGKPRPFYADVKALAAEFVAASPILTDTIPAAQVALLYSFDSRWAIQNQRHHRDFDYVKHFIHYYRPLAIRNIPAAAISPDTSLDGYKLIIAPALNVLTESQAKYLSEFARTGGYLVLTARTGMKDDANALIPARQPGWLREAAGAEVEDYYALLEPVQVQAEGWEGRARIWGERLKVLDPDRTRVLARYGEGQGWLTGQPAITLHNYGSGKVYLVGAYLDDAAQDTLLAVILREAGIQPVLETPTGVEACLRVAADGREVFILVNHGNVSQRVLLPWQARDHLRGQIGTALTLEPYGAAVLTRER